ncbi:alpha/beta hydrolase [Vibrio neptunius]|uniref:alpha/beta hydrolase n=1 Tax=Vibrio neptunius TaxID=170651 RepID=UPI001C5C96CF|nr:alpha/beta hydrolase [Vibrio neptunius]QXX07848.1 alpha/beta hydrolase [Vibrio neptunius]
MTNYKHLLLAAPLIVLAACNSSSGNNSNRKGITQDKPLANYNFNDTDLASVLAERRPLLDSMSVSFDGTTYNRVRYAEELGEERLVIHLQNSSDKGLDLFVTTDDDSDCAIYREGELYDLFACGDSTQSESGNKTLIQSVTQKVKKSIKVEFNNELIGDLSSIGSTILTATDNSIGVDIDTSFAFTGFYKDVFGITSADERIHSTLGVSTYLELASIVQKYPGQKMVIKFNNNIGGSADDDINMYTGMMIHNQAMKTVVTPKGSVFSGGTDLFAAGQSRVLQRSKDVDNIETNKQIGVHSWSNGNQSAKQIPYTDASHRKQATYFKTMLGDKGVDFYLFTLDAAPVEGEHWITKAESDKFKFITSIE